VPDALGRRDVIALQASIHLINLSISNQAGVTPPNLRQLRLTNKLLKDDGIFYLDRIIPELFDPIGILLKQGHRHQPPQFRHRQLLVRQPLVMAKEICEAINS
jgi:hypothetical protein